MQIDQGVEIQHMRLSVSYFQLVWQSYSRLVLLLIVNSLESSLAKLRRKTNPPILEGKHLTNP